MLYELKIQTNQYLFIVGHHVEIYMCTDKASIRVLKLPMPLLGSHPQSLSRE